MPNESFGGTCAIGSRRPARISAVRCTIGRYIADFAMPQARKLIIEVDGGQHGDEPRSAMPSARSYSKRNGYRVLRFWNNDVLTNIDGVLDGHSALR